jgi:cytidine/deoxycytidylate deaminase-like protein
VRTDSIEKRLHDMVKFASRQQPAGKHRVLCEAWRDDALIAWGRNVQETRFSHPDFTKPELVGTHAETCMVLEAEGRNVDLTGAVVLIARAKKTRRGGPVIPGNAAPCPECMRLLRSKRVGGIYWTLDEEGYGKT